MLFRSTTKDSAAVVSGMEVHMIVETILSVFAAAVNVWLGIARVEMERAG